MIKFYLFENASDLLDTLSKISDIIIAVLTLLFSIYIFYFTTEKAKSSENYNKKIDFFKTIILSNLNHLFNFYESLFYILKELKSRQINDEEKDSLNSLMQDELKNFRLKFYDLTITYDRTFYNDLKNESDKLIDKLTENIFEIDNFNEDNVYENRIESPILFSRQIILSKIYNEFR